MKSHPLFSGAASVFVALPLLFLFVFALLPKDVFAANNDPFRGGREAVSPKQSAGVVQSTGAMTYTYPLTIPPGRSGVQPNLSLNYSSDDKRQDSIFGYGWSLSLPYIERINKIGTNNLYNQDRSHTYFTSSLSGELLTVGSETPVGGSFLGISQDPSLLALVELPDEEAMFDASQETISTESTNAPDSNFATVSADIARSFHTFMDTFLSTYVYHPNEWEDWFAARNQAMEEAKRPISGFPVVERKTQRSLYAVIPFPLIPALAGLSATDRATLKGEAIAALGPIEKTTWGSYQIEVVSVNPVEGGVELFVKVWDANNQQVGFGVDGTIEIERVRIFNPPILVPDGTTHDATTTTGLIVRTNNYKEDLRAALLQVLADTIAVVPTHDASHIVSGKVGRTTDTYYPDAASETTSVDGFVGNGGDISWSSLQGGSGTGSDHTTTNDTTAAYASSVTSNLWAYMYRAVYLFDTSALPDGDSISSATLSVYGTAKASQWGDYVTVSTSSPGSNTTLVNSDFAKLGTTEMIDSGSRILDANWNTAGWNDFTLNATGISNISATGVTKFGLRFLNDINNNAPTWVSSQSSNLIGYYADQTGTTNDPKLVVVHGTGPVYPSAPTALFVDGITNPSNIATTSPYFSA